MQLKQVKEEIANRDNRDKRTINLPPLFMLVIITGGVRKNFAVFSQFRVSQAQWELVVSPPQGGSTVP